MEDKIVSLQPTLKDLPIVDNTQHINWQTLYFTTCQSEYIYTNQN